MITATDPDDRERRDHGPRGHAFRGERPAQEDRDDRVHVGVRRDARRRRGAEQEDVRRETEQRARHDEVEEREERSARDGGDREAVPLAEQRRDSEEDGAAGDHLHRRRHQRRRGKLRAPGIEGTERPQERRRQQRAGAEQVHVRAPGELSRSDEERQAPEARRQADEHDPVRPPPVLDPVEDGHPDRHAGDDQGRQPRRHALLGPAHQAVAAEEHQRADRRGGTPVAALRRRSAPQAQPAEEQDAGRQVPQPRHQEGRNRLDAEADREVRRAPEDVDGRERQHELRAGGGAAEGARVRHGASPAPWRIRSRRLRRRGPPPPRRRGG